MNKQIVSNLCCNKLFQERLKHGLSRADLACIADVSCRAIAKFEAGLQLPTRRTYNRLAHVFGWEVWE